MLKTGCLHVQYKFRIRLNLTFLNRKGANQVFKKLQNFKANLLKTNQELIFILTIQIDVESKVTILQTMVEYLATQVENNNIICCVYPPQFTFKTLTLPHSQYHDHFWISRATKFTLLPCWTTSAPIKLQRDAPYAKWYQHFIISREK